MDREMICSLFEKYIRTVVPELEEKEIDRNESFDLLGVNSLDRVDVISMVLEEVSLQVSQIELFNLNSVDALADFLSVKLQKG